MRIENDNSFVEFEFKERMEFQNDIACRVKVFSDEFSGKINSVWFSEYDIDLFIQELEKFDKRRKGSVELHNIVSSTDGNPLEFAIFSTDALGHLAIRVSLQKDLYFLHSGGYNGRGQHKTSVVFEIDPTLLPSIIRDFKKLFLTNPTNIA